MSHSALKINDPYQRLRRYLVSGYIVITAVLVALSSWFVQSERASRLRLAESETSTLARALEEHVLRTFGSVDAMLRRASGRLLERGDLKTQDSASVRRLLQQEAANIPFVRSLYVDDRFGYGHTTSQGVNIRNLHARDFEHIRHFYKQRDDRLYVGRPSKGSVAGRLNIPVARQMVNARGEFAGVIGTSIDPEYFENFYRALGLNAGTSLSLVRNDGVILVRVPPLSRTFDDVSQSRFFQEQISQKPFGTLDVERSIIDGAARLLSFRRVGDTNLIVVIARARDSILASSRRLAFGVSAMVGSSLIALSFLLLLALRQLKHRAEAEERYALMVRGTNDGIWDWNILNHACYLSPRWKEIVGFSDDELPNLESSFFGLMHPDDQRRMEAAVNRRTEEPAAYSLEMRLRHKDGHHLWVLMRGEPVRDKQGQTIRMVGSTSDITERKRAEEQTQASLREKETLLREVHHRVKNNLQIISSLLYLQSGTLADATARQALKESQDRVHSMALVHERLYRSSTLGAIDFGEHLRQLAGSVARSSGPASGRVRLELDLASIAVDLDLAVPVSLIFNEVLANAYKHAFPGERAGTIEVAFLADEPETLTLQVRDNGVGLPPDFEYDRGRSLGLKIVRNLTEQIHGQFTIQSRQGMRFQLSFANSKTAS